MINPARPNVGPPLTGDEQSSQASGPRRPVVSMSAVPPALGQARTHRCEGAGDVKGRCPVVIPIERTLCHFCTKTERLGGNSKGITCPQCIGVITDPNHFMTAGHVLSIAGSDLAEIVRGRDDNAGHP